MTDFKSLEIETLNCGNAAGSDQPIDIAHYGIALRSLDPKIRCFQEVPDDVVRTLKNSEYHDRVKAYQRVSIKRDHSLCCGAVVRRTCADYTRIEELGKWLLIVWSRHFEFQSEAVPSILSDEALELGRRISNWVSLRSKNGEEVTLINVHFQVPGPKGTHPKTGKIMYCLKREAEKFAKTSKVFITGDFNTTPENLRGIGVDVRNKKLVGTTKDPTNVCSKTGTMLRLDYILSYSGLERHDMVLPREQHWDHSQLRATFY